MRRQSVLVRDLSRPELAVGLGICLAGSLCEPSRADATRDVQLIGLSPLYEALFAVSNCPNVGLDVPAFRRAIRLYHLSTIDLTIDGAFSPEIAQLTTDYRIRLEDDHDAFCSVNRLSFAVPNGVLVDRGPVVPHPLPFAISPY